MMEEIASTAFRKIKAGKIADRTHVQIVTEDDTVGIMLTMEQTETLIEALTTIRGTNTTTVMQAEINSERLTYRLIETADLNDIHVLHSKPETDEFNTLGIPNNKQETKRTIETWIADNNKSDTVNFTFTIRQSSGSNFIGLIALKPGNLKFRTAEIWYKLDSKYWNKGFGTEALSRLLDFGFDELKLHRIEAGCAVRNLASIRILEKVGMIKEGQKRKILPLKSGWSDNFEFAILETDKRYNLKTARNETK